MGLAVINSSAGYDDIEIAAVWVRNPETAGDMSTPSGVLISSDLDHVVERADVVIDFSLPEATDSVLAAVSQQARPLVCGVSGLEDRTMQALRDLGKSIPLVYDRNMSQGVAVLTDLVERAARSLGEGFSVAIHETHHIHKKDAPSGTALKLGEAVSMSRSGTGHVDIHYESERRGEVPGEHEVIFTSATEKLALGHNVTTRQVFADGALRAARWVVNQAPGLYGMHDVLFSADSR
jgi:4-hydroxy-tetrahydrodipicolinate reductase